MTENDQQKYPAIYVTPDTRDRLRELASKDHRSVPQAVAWLVEQEFTRRTEDECARRAVAEDVPPAS